MAESDPEPVVFVEQLVSRKFSTLFKSASALIEETATYLDGPGRQESKKLLQHEARAYAEVSVLLTTRLMRCCSWLLLFRAHLEGECSRDAFLEEKRLLKPPTLEQTEEEETIKPEDLRYLVARSFALTARILDTDTAYEFGGRIPKQRAGPDSVPDLLVQLKKAFP